MNSYSCVWQQDADGNWNTSCDNLHVFINGTPFQNNYRFCPYCGGELIYDEETEYNALEEAT